MPIEWMNRLEVLQELAKLSHPEHYHGMLSWSTDDLKELLVYYRTL